MRARCLQKNNRSYQNYGGRGIAICERWDSFENFLADLGERPEGYSIERKDVNGNYEPGNCMWLETPKQARNRRSSVQITFRGRTQLLTDWSNELGISSGCISNRIARGWSPEEALTIPVGTAKIKTIRRNHVARAALCA
jgi:hypothetical protein